VHDDGRSGTWFRRRRDGETRCAASAASAHTATTAALRRRRGRRERGRGEEKRWWARNCTGIVGSSILETLWARGMRRTVLGRKTARANSLTRGPDWAAAAAALHARASVCVRATRGRAAGHWLGRAALARAGPSGWRELGCRGEKAGPRARWPTRGGRLARGGGTGSWAAWRARAHEERAGASGPGGERGEERGAGGLAEMGQGRGWATFPFSFSFLFISV
jgi:hypothetical protein